MPAPLTQPENKIAPPAPRPAGSRVVGAVALAYVAWCAVGHLRSAEASSLFGMLDYGVHEFGHLFFGLFGWEWLAVAGGSIMQLLVPGLVALLFWKQRERLGVAVCGGWLALSLGRMAVYMADARVLELDLVSFSPDASGHDWNYLFTSLGVIDHDTGIAAAVRSLGWLVLLASVGFGARELLRPASKLAAGDQA